MSLIAIDDFLKKKNSDSTGERLLRIGKNALTLTRNFDKEIE